MFDKITALYRSRNKQTGQGMVEFGLVIPILLLLMLGIIAFGHLFFSYTLVVAASREAARFGIATGLSDTNLPRFRDCDAIRAAAVRAGSFSGVTPEKVTVWYDEGPCGEDCEPVVVGTCPAGGIGPGTIDIGERLVVRVAVDYEPIVPIGWIPEMPLEAVMRRTIIRTVYIDDQDIAAGEPCNIGTITRVIPPDWDNPTSMVGEDVIFQVEVIDDEIDTDYPAGTVTLYITDESAYDPALAYCTKPVGGSTPAIIECDPITSAIWDAAGTHTIRAMYEPDAGECFLPSRAEPWIHTVN